MQKDLVPATAKGQRRPKQTSLDYRSCPFCKSAETAGSSNMNQQVFQKVYGASQHLKRDNCQGGSEEEAS